MGRKKKYSTPEEKRQAYNQMQMDYYWRNKKKIQEKNLKRYYDKKEIL